MTISEYKQFIDEMLKPAESMMNNFIEILRGFFDRESIYFLRKYNFIDHMKTLDFNRSI